MNHLTATSSQLNPKSYNPQPYNPYHSLHTPKELIFMNHFETINKHNQTYHHNHQELQSHQDKYTSLIKDYHKNSSYIDSVYCMQMDMMEISGLKWENMVDGSVLPNFKEKLKEEINQIKHFFKGRKYQNYKHLESQEFMAVETYSEILASFGRNIQIPQKSRILTSKPKEILQPQPHIKQLKQIQVDTSQLNSHFPQKQKTKRLDIILMQLTHEKKRKSLVNDYFMTMQLKLMELLDYILEDEVQYHNLDASSKTRLILKNLQSFKGKILDGESKINLLKVFFQEFTALKKQKEQMQLRTPKKVEGARQKQQQYSTTAGLTTSTGVKNKNSKIKESVNHKVKKQHKKDISLMNNHEKIKGSRGNKFLQQPQWIQNLP